MSPKTRLLCLEQSAVPPEPGAVSAGPAARPYPARLSHYGGPAADASSAPSGQRTVAQAPLPRCVGHAEGLPERGSVSGAVGLGPG